MSHQHIYHLPLRRQFKGENVGIPRGYLPPTKKRRHASDEEDEFSEPELSAEENDSEEGSDVEEEEQTRSGTPQLTHLSRDVIDQFTAAGLKPSDPIPEPPFPAAPEGYSARQFDALKEAKKQLRELHPPLYEPPVFSSSKDGKVGSQQQHLGVMNAIVHRFLAQGDYARASRAWGLLIRAMPDGTDVRAFGRWGIGAEILMRRPENFGHDSLLETEPEPEMSGALAPLNHSGQERSMSEAISIHDSDSSSDEDSDSNVEAMPQIRTVQGSDDESITGIRTVSPSTSQSRGITHDKSDTASVSSTKSTILPPTLTHDDMPGIWIPDSNLEAAKQYYERLIIRHAPLHRNITPEQRAKQPNFYPAFLSVWIYQVTQRSRKATLRVEKAKTLEEQQSTEEDEMDIDSDDSSIDRRKSKWDASITRIRQKELVDAKEVAERLDNILEGPPYDSDPQLLRLRGMVGQWIADLLRPATRRGDDAHLSDTSLGDDMDDGSEMAQQLRIARAMFTRAGDFERPGGND
jgi:hypothetical protein